MAWLRLNETVRQFEAPLFEQLDLSMEAMHLERFRKNFIDDTYVTFPRPLYPFVEKDVLMETFEQGWPVDDFLAAHKADAEKLGHEIAAMGTKIMMKMMLNDNFIHADLHPGNVLVSA